MTVKAKRGRRRYIAFDVPQDLDAGSLARSIPVKGFKVIQCAGGMAVVRCGADNVQACIDTVTGNVEGQSPRRTSGTLKSLRDRYGILRDTRPPRPR